MALLFENKIKFMFPKTIGKMYGKCMVGVTSIIHSNQSWIFNSTVSICAENVT